MNRQEQEQFWAALRLLQQQVKRLSEDLEELRATALPFRPVKRDLSRKARM